MAVLTCHGPLELSTAQQLAASWQLGINMESRPALGLPLIQTLCDGDLVTNQMGSSNLSELLAPAGHVITSAVAKITMTERS